MGKSRRSRRRNGKRQVRLPQVKKFKPYSNLDEVTKKLREIDTYIENFVYKIVRSKNKIRKEELKNQLKPTINKIRIHYSRKKVTNNKLYEKIISEDKNSILCTEEPAGFYSPMLYIIEEIIKGAGYEKSTIRELKSIKSDLETSGSDYAKLLMSHTARQENINSILKNIKNCKLDLEDYELDLENFKYFGKKNLEEMLWVVMDEFIKLYGKDFVFRQFNSSEFNLYIIACKFGDELFKKFIIKYYDSKYLQCQASLYNIIDYLIEGEDLEKLKYLIENQPKQHIEELATHSDFGEIATPLMRATDNCDYNMVKYLVEKGFLAYEKSDSLIDSILRNVIVNRHKERKNKNFEAQKKIAELLIENGCSLLEEDENGSNFFHYFNYSEKMVNFIIDKMGGEFHNLIRKMDKNGECPLQSIYFEYLYQNGDKVILDDLDLMIKIGCDPNNMGSKGEAIIKEAVEDSMPELVDMLLSRHKGKLLQEDVERAFEMSLEDSRFTITKIFIHHGVKIKGQSNGFSKIQDSVIALFLNNKSFKRVKENLILQVCEYFSGGNFLEDKNVSLLNYSIFSYEKSSSLFEILTKRELELSALNAAFDLSEELGIQSVSDKLFSIISKQERNIRKNKNKEKMSLKRKANIRLFKVLERQPAPLQSTFLISNNGNLRGNYPRRSKAELIEIKKKRRLERKGNKFFKEVGKHKKEKGSAITIDPRDILFFEGEYKISLNAHKLIKIENHPGKAGYIYIVDEVMNTLSKHDKEKFRKSCERIVRSENAAGLKQMSKLPNVRWFLPGEFESAMDQVRQKFRSSRKNKFKAMDFESRAISQFSHCSKFKYEIKILGSQCNSLARIGVLKATQNEHAVLYIGFKFYPKGFHFAQQNKIRKQKEFFVGEIALPELKSPKEKITII